MHVFVYVLCACAHELFCNGTVSVLSKKSINIMLSTLATEYIYKVLYEVEDGYVSIV